MLELDTAGLAGLPGIELPALTGLLMQFFFAMLRIGAFLVASPFYSSPAIPVMVRVVASGAMALAVMSLYPMPDPAVLATPAAVLLMATELAVGLSGGMVLTILFGAVTLAGEKIATTCGLGFAAQYDPSAGGQTPLISNILGLFLLVVFLSLDGHLVALSIMLESYQRIPPGTPIAAGALIAAGVTAGGQMFVLAAKIMLPVVSVLVMINISIGVITRSAPQLNIFSFGFPITMLAAFILLYFNVPSLGSAFAYLVEFSQDALETMIGEAAGG